MTDRLAAIAVGSNVGDRLTFLNHALILVDRIPGIGVLATSRVYESEGWGREGLKPFLNAAFVVDAGDRDGQELLLALQRVEDRLGRQRTLKWGPRTLDLDLLALAGETAASPTLTLPHPWIAHRPFVYFPLSELVHLYPSWRPLLGPHEEGVAIEKDSRPLESPTPLWGESPPVRPRWTLHSNSEEETLELGRRLAGGFTGGEVVALNAPMGTGKSVLARGIARGLGIRGPIQSPSYTLCRKYEAGPLTLEHWDFYRLGSLDDLESTGYFDMPPPGTIRVIEWAESFPEAVPDAHLVLEMIPQTSTARRLDLIGGDPARPLPFPARVAAANFSMKAEPV